MPESLEILSLKTNQLSQVQEQARSEIYNLQLKTDLLIKMLEEKGLMAEGEFNKRWPLYLKNNIGAIGPDGLMEGTCKVAFYGVT
jgi:hypothetical protein